MVGDHVLRILFSDGMVGDVDFSAEHWTGVLEPLNDPAYMAQAAVDAEAGILVWPNGIDLAPDPLYEQAGPSNSLPSDASDLAVSAGDPYRARDARAARAAVPVGVLVVRKVLLMVGGGA